MHAHAKGQLQWPRKIDPRSHEGAAQNSEAEPGSQSSKLDENRCHRPVVSGGSGFTNFAHILLVRGRSGPGTSLWTSGSSSRHPLVEIMRALLAPSAYPTQTCRANSVELLCDVYGEGPRAGLAARDARSPSTTTSSATASRPSSTPSAPPPSAAHARRPLWDIARNARSDVAPSQRQSRLGRSRQHRRAVVCRLPEPGCGVPRRLGPGPRAH